MSHAFWHQGNNELWWPSLLNKPCLLPPNDSVCHPSKEGGWSGSNEILISPSTSCISSAFKYRKVSFEWKSTVRYISSSARQLSIAWHKNSRTNFTLKIVFISTPVAIGEETTSLTKNDLLVFCDTRNKSMSDLLQHKRPRPLHRWNSFTRFPRRDSN